jgi:hypothetical protein
MKILLGYDNNSSVYIFFEVHNGLMFLLFEDTADFRVHLHIDISALIRDP